MKFNSLTVSVLTLSSVVTLCAPALAGQTGSDFSNFSGHATRWNGGHTSGHSVTNYTREHTESGHFTGQSFSFKADTIAPQSGDYKATFNPDSQSFGVWANKGQSVFAVSGSSSETANQWNTTENEQTKTWTNFESHFENDANGFLLEGYTNSWGN